MESADRLRPVAPLDLAFAEITPGAPPTDNPIIEWMSPSDLLIDGAYQRDLSPKSITLICAIIAGWDWRKFKPPIVAWTEAGFVVIDGQHTTIAAASHPDIDKIPCLVVEAVDVSDQAKAFIGHNKDRVAVTAVQIHHAALAAGDEDAQTVEMVCQRAGVIVVRGAYGGYPYKPGDTIAVGTIQALISRRHAKGAREILAVLVASGRAPIVAADIRAVEWLMTDPEYADQVDGDAIVDAIRNTVNADQEAKVNAKMLNLPFWKGLGMAWFKKARKKRRAA